MPTNTENATQFFSTDETITEFKTSADTGMTPEDALAQVNAYWAGLGLPSLTTDQYSVIKDILATTQARPSYTSALEGPAGTGKTTLLLGLIMSAGLMDITVEVAALTHKACSVLADKLEAMRFDWEGRLPTPATLHSTLGLVPKPPKFNMPQEFVQKTTPEMRNVDLLIVDECSMIGENLLEYITILPDTQKVDLLFAGDPHQLRPVNERKKSKSFTEVDVKYELTKVLRHDGAILNLATLTRKMRSVPIVKADRVSEDSMVYVHADRRDFESAWLTVLAQFEEVGRADEVIMLTYKNKTRAEYNVRARKALFGPNTPKFMEGDTVIALDAIVKNEKVWFNNNEDIHIVGEPVFHQEAKPLPHLGNVELDYWEIKTTKGYLLYVLDSGQETVFKSMLRQLGKEIELQVKEANSVTELRNAKARWREDYFALKEMFSNVDFRYALTIHKSQGSTYENVFLNNDYRQGRDEATSLFYVGVTRASKNVHIINNQST